MNTRKSKYFLYCLFTVLYFCIQTINIYGQIEFSIDKLLINSSISCNYIDSITNLAKKENNSIIGFSIIEGQEEPSLSISCTLNNKYLTDTVVWMQFSKFRIYYSYLNKEYMFDLKYYDYGKNFINSNEKSYIKLSNDILFSEIWDGSYFIEKILNNDTMIVRYRKQYIYSILKVIPTIRIECDLAISKFDENVIVYDEYYFRDKLRKYKFQISDIPCVTFEWSNCKL